MNFFVQVIFKKSKEVTVTWLQRGRVGDKIVTQMCYHLFVLNVIRI